MPYPALQSLFDGLLPEGLQWYWKGDFVKTLPDAAIAAYVAHGGQAAERRFGMHIYPIDGAVHRAKEGRDGVELRATQPGRWSSSESIPDPQNAPAIKKWARDYWDAVHPYNLAGAYPNFMMDDEGDERARGDLRGQLRAPRRDQEEIRSQPTCSM